MSRTPSNGSTPVAESSGPAAASSAAEPTQTATAVSTAGAAPIAAPPPLSVEVNAIDDPDAQAVLEQHLPELTRCYQAALEADDSTEVEWVCFYVRDVSGKVTSVDIPGEPHQQLRMCIVEAVKALALPEPKNPGEKETFIVVMKRTGE